MDAAEIGMRRSEAEPVFAFAFAFAGIMFDMAPLQALARTAQAKAGNLSVIAARSRKTSQ